MSEFYRATRMRLDTYHGIGSTNISFDNYLPQRFMEIADMRKDISVVKAKDGQNKPYLQSYSWFIPIDDEALMGKARTLRGRSEDEAFFRLFRGRVVDGVSNCLESEKLSNGGGSIFLLMAGYLMTGMVDIRLPLGAISASVSRGEGVETTLLRLTTGLVLASFFNFGFNSLTKIFAESIFHSPEREPFIPQSFDERFLPPVPIHRLVRGHLFLAMHGGSLLKYNPSIS